MSRNYLKHEIAPGVFHLILRVDTAEVSYKILKTYLDGLLSEAYQELKDEMEYRALQKLVSNGAPLVPYQRRKLEQLRRERASKLAETAVNKLAGYTPIVETPDEQRRRIEAEFAALGGEDIPDKPN